MIPCQRRLVWVDQTDSPDLYLPVWGCILKPPQLFIRMAHLAGLTWVSVSDIELSNSVALFLLVTCVTYGIDENKYSGFC